MNDKSINNREATFSKESVLKVSVCIVNYNGMSFINECTRSVLRSLDGIDSEVILIDNKSTDGSGTHVAERYPQVRVIFSGRNLGYAGGANLGFKHSTSEYFVVLNNDVRVNGNWATELIEFMDRNADVGVAGCTVRAGNDVWNKGTMSVVGDNIWEAKTTEPFYVAGVCMIVRMRIVDKPFDDDYFLAAEDVYLCWLLRLKGYKIGLARKAVLYHLASRSRDRVPITSYFYGERNRVLNLLIFYSLPTLLKLLPLILLSRLMQRQFHACSWLLRNWRFVLQKRKGVQNQRKVNDKGMTRHMSSRLSHHNEILNTVSRSYLKLMKIKTVET